MFEIVADSSRQLIAAGVLLSYCACCIGSWRGYRAKQRSISHATGDRLIVWASQSGNAQQLAQQYAARHNAVPFSLSYAQTQNDDIYAAAAASGAAMAARVASDSALDAYV